MTYGVYVGSNRTRGKKVFTTGSLREAVEFAESESGWPWVWVRVV